MAIHSSISSAKGDKDRALAVFTDGRQKFLNFVRSSVYDPGEAEEIVQRASLKIVLGGGSLRDPDRAEAWIYRLLRNEIADYFRRRAIEVARTPALPVEEFPALPSVERSLCSCAIEELPNLHSGYGDALQAIEMGGETIVAYAARRGMSANSATVRLHRARKSLRARLEQRCGSCAGAGCFDCSCGHGPAAPPITEISPIKV